VRGFHAASHRDAGFSFSLTQKLRDVSSRNFHSGAIVAPYTLGQLEAEERRVFSGDIAMTLHNEMSEASSQHVRLPACPACGDMLLAPLLAEHVSPRLVRNHWACESCGHTFRKAYAIEAGEFEDA